jgi:hypothetical protein
MSMHDEYAAHVYRPMPVYFKDVIQHVIRRIDGGSVCDLGSHAMGSYWAAGYIERVDSYSCYDLSEEALIFFRKYIQDLRPGDIEKHHPDLLLYLREQGIIKAPIEEIEKQIVSKLGRVEKFDFLKDTPPEQYDIVMANESLPVVDTFEQFVTGIKTAREFLKDGGLLLTVSGPFEELNADVEEMQSYRIEGRLNPSTEVFGKALELAGFRSIETMTIPVNEFDNYNNLTICSARR